MGINREQKKIRKQDLILDESGSNSEKVGMNGGRGGDPGDRNCQSCSSLSDFGYKIQNTPCTPSGGGGFKG